MLAWLINPATKSARSLRSDPLHQRPAHHDQIPHHEKMKEAELRRQQLQSLFYQRR